MASRLLVAAALAVAAPSAGVAQVRPDLAAAITSGVVGERFDGYLGYAVEPSAAVKRQVGAVNIRRRALYIRLAAQRSGVTPQLAAIATACVLLPRIPVGRVYMLSDGKWRRRNPGEPPPAPRHCRR